MVADGLSRVPTAQLVAMTVSSIDSALLEQVKQSWLTDDNIQVIINRLNNGESVPKYSYSQGLLCKNGRVVVGNDAALHFHIIKLFYDSSFGGHSGVAVTVKRVSCMFWWKGLSKDIRNYIRSCSVCHRYKADLSALGFAATLAYSRCNMGRHLLGLC